jgi:hypothetical protein
VQVYACVDLYQKNSQMKQTDPARIKTSHMIWMWDAVKNGVLEGQSTDKTTRSPTKNEF